MTTLQKAIKSKLGADFPDAKIVSVTVKEDEDSEGERVLKITVVFDSSTGKIDAKRAAEVVRRVRPTLHKRGETAFPIFSFLTKADAELAGAAA